MKTFKITVMIMIIRSTVRILIMAMMIMQIRSLKIIDDDKYRSDQFDYVCSKNAMSLMKMIIITIIMHYSEMSR